MEKEFKLVKLSKNSWHYKLIKWFLGDAAPTPSNTFNFCRYFWIFMFCLLIMTPIVGPFKVLYHVIVFILDKTLGALAEMMEDGLRDWAKNIDESKAYDIWWDGYWSNIPKKYKNCKNKDEVLAIWAKENFNMDWDDLEDRDKLVEELKKVREERQALKDEAWNRKMEAEKLAQQREAARKELLAKINNKLGFIGRGWDRFASWVSKLADFDYSTIITIAKRTFGVIISTIFLVAAYFIVNFLTQGLLIFGGLIVGSWKEILIIFGILIAVFIVSVIIYYIVLFIRNWFEEVIDTYKGGDSIWYIQALYWVIVAPLYYLIYKPLYWIVMVPLNFIFNHIIYQLICMKWIVPFAIWVWKGIIGFTGIFGEYFGASYGDYCPGIEWEEE
jgi:hypothetical protein